MGPCWAVKHLLDAQLRGGQAEWYSLTGNRKWCLKEARRHGRQRVDQLVWRSLLKAISEVYSFNEPTMVSGSTEHQFFQELIDSE